MLETLNELKQKALTELQELSSVEALDKWHIAYLGRKGALTALLRSVGQLAPQERPAAGQEANRVKTALEQAYTAKAETLQDREAVRRLQQEQVDVTLPGRPAPAGYLHVVTQTLREIYAIFSAILDSIAAGRISACLCGVRHGLC